MHTQETTIIHVRIPPDLRVQLERLADAEDRPLSSWVRRVLKAEATRQATEQRGQAA